MQLLGLSGLVSLKKLLHARQAKKHIIKYVCQHLLSGYQGLSFQAKTLHIQWTLHTFTLFFQLWNLPLLTSYLNILKLQSSNQTALHCVRPWQETRFYYHFLVSQKFGERYSPQSIPSAHVLLDHISNFLSGFLPQTNWQCLAMTQIKSTKEANALTQWLTRSWWLKEDS